MRFDKVSLAQYLEDLQGDFLRSSDHITMVPDIIEGKVRFSEDFVALTQLSPADVYEDIKLPKRATTKSAGYDFYAPYDFCLYPGQTIKLATGIRVLLDDDKFLMCAPRSGHGFKARVQLDNTIGIIDADYSDSSKEGHIMVKLTNDSREGKFIKVGKGEAYMQGIILSYYKVDDDNTTELRDGGFGSTTSKEAK